METEVQVTCSSLGYLEGSIYHQEPDCLEGIKDLILFLRRDNETCDIRRMICASGVLRTDLMPLLSQHSHDKVLFETLIRLLVNLTQPTLSLFDNEIPTERDKYGNFLELEQHLQNCKQGFCDEKVCAEIAARLGELLQLDWENRQEEDRLLVERILTVIRNILMIQVSAGIRTDDDASCHDELLWAMHSSGLLDMVVYIASASSEVDFSLHVIEIFFYIFKEHSAEQLATAGKPNKQENDELRELIEREQAEQKRKIFTSNSRHSRFGGTFILKNEKSISQRDQIYYGNIGTAKNFSHDKGKRPKKIARNRAPVREIETNRQSTLSIRLMLCNLCSQVLHGAYNSLMRQVKSMLEHNRGQQHDEAYFLWGMTYFMEFLRKYQFRIDFVSETVSVDSLHYIQSTMSNYQVMMMSEKKDNGKTWARRLHCALRAYKEFLLTLTEMSDSKDPAVHKSAKVLQENLFYMIEYREIFFHLLKKFDRRYQSREHLRDLVEASHVFIKMISHYNKKRGTMVIQKVKKKKAKVRPKAADPPLSEEAAEDLWKVISAKLPAVMKEELPVADCPFDAGSDLSDEEQKVKALRNIQNFLKKKKLANAVSLLQMCRTVWPEGEQFGSANVSEEEEIAALCQILRARLPAIPEEQVDFEIEEEIVEEFQPELVTSEETFNLTDYCLQYANVDVVSAVVFLLESFLDNSTFTNHCAVTLLHRVGFMLHCIGVLFQARLFRVFQRVLTLPAGQTSRFCEMRTFACKVFEKFVETARKNDKVFVEILFWKNVKESMELVDGYGTSQSSHDGKKLWTEEEEMEVKRLSEEYDDDCGVDLADFVQERLIDQNKSRRQVIRQLLHLGLIGSAKEMRRRRKKTSGARRAWSNEEEQQLLEAYGRLREVADPVSAVIAEMQTERSRKKIVDKLVELGAITDKKAVQRKRPRKGKNRQEETENWEDELEDNEQLQRDAEKFAEVRLSVQNLYQQGWKDSLQWLQNNLEQAADDIMEDPVDESAIPLVPITEMQNQFMDHGDVNVLLRRLGLHEPLLQQERYWRIPGGVKHEEVRRLAVLLDVDDASGESLVRELIESSDGQRSDDSCDSSDDNLVIDESARQESRCTNLDLPIVQQTAEGSDIRVEGDQVLSGREVLSVSDENHTLIKRPELLSSDDETLPSKRPRVRMILSDSEDEDNKEN